MDSNLKFQKDNRSKNNESVRRCQRCVLPEICPKIEFDKNGVCNVCRDFEKRWGKFRDPEYLTFKKIELKKIFDSYKNKGRTYDCLVPLSGGMDSTYVLYVCKRIYNLSVFAFNFDNGFQSQLARENMKKAVRELDVDFVSYKPSWKLQKKLYSLFFLKTGEFCTPCNVGIRSLSYKFAKDLGIPLIVSGDSERIEVQSPQGAHIYHWSPSYFKEVIRGKIPFEEAADYLYYPETFMEKVTSRLLKHIPFSRHIRTIHLPDYLEWNVNSILKTLRSEIGWKHDPEKHDHIDCIMDPVRVYLRQRKWGFSAALKYSTLIRNGQIGRRQALEKTLQEEAIASREPPILQRWLRLLALSKEDLEEFETRSQLPYISTRTQVKHRLLKIMEKGASVVSR